MALWWLGNIIFIAVIIPVVLLLLNRVLRPIKEIRAYGDDILEHGVGLTGALDSVPELVRTSELATVARANVERYGAAVQKLL